MILFYGPQNDRYVYRTRTPHPPTITPAPAAASRSSWLSPDGAMAMWQPGTGRRGRRLIAQLSASWRAARRARIAADVASRHALPPPQRRRRSGGSVAAAVVVVPLRESRGERRRSAVAAAVAVAVALPRRGRPR